MSVSKICFITCVNNDDIYQKSLSYISNLDVPAGYSIDSFSIKEAESMTSGYNKAIRHNDAKYKVYLHQDVSIINKSFIQDFLHIFSDTKVGMIGVAGSSQIPSNGIWWESRYNFGKVYDSHTGMLSLLSFRNVEAEFEQVQCVDGLIMITQYDIPWREDIFTGWHFYDLSQSLEFIRAGYKVIVPRQCTPWCIHDCGLTIVRNDYHNYRQVFLNEYGKDLKIRQLNNGPII
ncbi:glycosyltransferase family protein [Sporomusa sp. KB1]|jgi:hypothetical protein|uniref:glycosyltransferase family protein n=1 Tax=Sporomusa sp. KB1 TaxID=943346 RepID=UPI0011A53B29|nr:glycosyltransferase family protein [Sporomusa sp. KB1]TWH46002.1 hypothetical protein Salpa_1940 [Sporomusa sp. KB1]